MKIKTIKVPDLIKIGYAVYTVEPFKEGVGEAKRRLGECNHHTKIIHMRFDVPNYEILNTLIHEIYHAIFQVYVIDSEDAEERIVTTLTNGWIQVYRDNPELIKFITKMLKGK